MQSLKDFLYRFWSKVEIQGPDDCWEWHGSRLKKGYGHLQLRTLHTTAHRVALELNLGRELSEGERALHTCDNPPCCNPRHLFPGDQLANMQDCVAKGRQSRVPSFGHRKLTEAQVQSIRSRSIGLSRGYKGTGSGPVFGAFRKRLALEFGVSARAIEKVMQGNTWRTQ